MSIAGKLIEELEEDEALRRRLLKVIAPELPKEPDVALMLANALLGRVATKDDLASLKEDLEKEITSVKNDLEKKITSLEEEMSSLKKEMWMEMTALSERMAKIEGQMSLFTKISIAFNLPILIAVLGILLKLAFG